MLADSFGVLAGISFYLSLFQGDHADQGRPALLRRGEQVRSETPVQKRLFICSLPFLVLPPSNARASLRQAGAVLQGGHTTRNSAPALSSVPRHSLSIQTWLSKDSETHRSGWNRRPNAREGKEPGGRWRGRTLNGCHGQRCLLKVVPCSVGELREPEHGGRLELRSQVDVRGATLDPKP